MSRIPRLTPDDLDDAQREVYQAIAGGPRAQRSAFSLTDENGVLEGPFNAMLLHPPLGDALQRLGSAIRYDGTLSARAREIAILAVAAHWQSDFEQYAHERVGVQIGLTQDEITALREGKRLQFADPEEAAVAEAAGRILDHNALTEAEYAEAAESLGPAKLFELTTLIGYYGVLALQLRIFDVGVRPAL